MTKRRVIDLSQQRTQFINSSPGNPGIGYQDPKAYRGQPAAYNPAQPWSKYQLDQAEWRVSVECGTEATLRADRAALAAQRPEEK